MRSLIAFIKKEFTEQLRSGRLIILGLLFVLFGIMNPAIAKLTPWLLETMADSLAESGMIITDVKVSAMDSWMQFFKNMPMGLIAFVLLESSIFTKEYTSGTLVLSLTKGLERYKVVISKALVLACIDKMKEGLSELVSLLDIADDTFGEMDRLETYKSINRTLGRWQEKYEGFLNEQGQSFTQTM